MIHFKNNFKMYIESLAAKHNYMPSLLEKDYYLTLILNEVNHLSERLIFKGGTCLNKIYFNYYRLSEDLDFIMEISDNALNRKQRKTLIKPVKENIGEVLKPLGLDLDDSNSGGFNESRQYLFIINYNSVFYQKEQNIKLEISIRFKNFLEPETMTINHLFLHPFTNEPLIKNGKIKCLNLIEAIAEKMRAAATRKNIAPRDFYDLYYISRQKPEIWNKRLLDLFLKKLEEDKFETDLEKYIKDMGRNSSEIENMKKMIEVQLLSVLKNEEKSIFNIENALETINRCFLEAVSSES